GLFLGSELVAAVELVRNKKKGPLKILNLLQVKKGMHPDTIRSFVMRAINNNFDTISIDCTKMAFRSIALEGGSRVSNSFIEPNGKIYSTLGQLFKDKVGR